jgi:hypothetical protein
MKIFQVRRHEFASVAQKGVKGLQMRLSKHEQYVNDIPNSVLLIGRSGTGLNMFNLPMPLYCPVFEISRDQLIQSFITVLIVFYNLFVVNRKDGCPCK